MGIEVRFYNYLFIIKIIQEKFIEAITNYINYKFYQINNNLIILTLNVKI
jgi:hypothetical protein